MDSPFQNLDLEMLLGDDRVVLLDNEFLLTDNLYTKGSTKRTARFSNQPPFKMTFTITVLCVKGSLHVRLNMVEYDIQTNDIFIAIPGQIGEFLGISEDARLIVIAHSGTSFQMIKDTNATLNIAKQLAKHPLFHVSEANMEESIRIYDLMRAKILETDNEFRRGAILGYMQVLTYNAYDQFSHSMENTPDKPYGRKEQIFEEFMQLVQEHYTSERSIKFYADALFLTPKYLSQVIYAVSGRYAGDWISDYVISESKILIKSKKYTILQVSEMLNFPNPSFFGKYFKAIVGYTPNKYRDSD